MKKICVLLFALASSVSVYAAVPLSVSPGSSFVSAGGNGNKVYVMPGAAASGPTCYSMAVYLSGDLNGYPNEFLSANGCNRALPRIVGEKRAVVADVVT
jgi:hypothetical protein